MTEILNSKVCRYHFIGTGTTYIYNHKKESLTIVSEGTQEVIKKMRVCYRNTKAFENACKEMFLDTVISSN